MKNDSEAEFDDAVDVEPGARIEREEIFGHVLAITKAEDFDYAIQIANDTDYELTGAVYSMNSEKITKITPKK